MGVPCVQSSGEAEALCAQLDEAGVSWILCVCVFPPFLILLLYSIAH